MSHYWNQAYPQHPYNNYYQPKTYDTHIKPLPLAHHYEHTNNIDDQLNKIYEKLVELEDENKKIKEEIENKKSLTVENVNYKIQDLHVEDLSGALLVGLSALSDAEELKKLLEDHDPITFNDLNMDNFQNNFINNEQNKNEDQ